VLPASNAAHMLMYDSEEEDERPATQTVLSTNILNNESSSGDGGVTATAMLNLGMPRM
jgi:hypothetical protein